MRIQHNIMAMSAYRNYTNNVSAMKKNLEKLSSGYKINRAGDDAAGLAISEKMRAQITGLETAQKNAKDGISLVQTAEGALTEVHDMLNRMVELATQSANGTYDNTTDRAQMQKEIEQLKSEINRIADSSNFNGIQLLDGSMDSTVKTTGDTELIAANTQIIADGQLAKNPQAGKYSIDFSNTTITAKGDGGDFTFTIFNQAALELSLGAGEELSGADLAQEIADLWNAAADDGITAWEDSHGFQMKATVEGDKLVFTMDKAPTSAFTAFAMSGKFGGFVSDATTDGVIGNNGEEVTVTVEQEAVDTTTLRMYGQANFTLVNGTAGAGEVAVEDGTTITIGDETYVFAVGKDSKYKNAANVVDLTDQEAKVSNTNLVKLAAQRLSNAAAGNGRFKVGTTLQSGVITVTEKEGGVDYTKNNLAGGDGKGTLGVTGRTKDATTDDWAGLIKTGKVDDKATGSGLTLQIGDTADDYNQLRVSIKDMHAASIGIGDISVADQDSAAEAVNKIKDAINTVSDVRGTLGATQNRLDHTINNLSVMTENIQDAESTIRDVDIAEEMMAYTKNNILIQSAQAMLAQANQVPQGVLQLLQ